MLSNRYVLSVEVPARPFRSLRYEHHKTFLRSRCTKILIFPTSRGPKYQTAGGTPGGILARRWDTDFGDQDDFPVGVINLMA